MKMFVHLYKQGGEGGGGVSRKTNKDEQGYGWGVGWGLEMAKFEWMHFMDYPYCYFVPHLMLFLLFWDLFVYIPDDVGWYYIFQI